MGAIDYARAGRQGRELSLDEAVAFYRGASARPAKKPTTTRSGRSGLTKRELQVADLVAQGMTNQQIAERLVISPRTAEGHVQRILDKMGFASRTRIAAWVAGRRAAGP